MQGPEIWLNALEIEVACVVEPTVNAILDEEHRMFVNYEAYYLSSSHALATFRDTPWRYTGRVTDPVSKKRFQPDGKTLSAEIYGRLFYFSSQKHADAFAETPHEYATPEVPYAGRM